MAAPDPILSSTNRAYAKKVADNFFTGIPTLEKGMAEGRVTYDSGRQIVEDIIKASPTGGAYVGLDPFAATDAEEVSAAIFEWMSYRAIPMISGMDLAKNEGAAGRIKLWAAKWQSAGMKVKEDVASALFADPTAWDSGLDVTPLEAIVDDGNTFTVGGINSDDVALWQGQRTAGGAAALSLLMAENAYLASSEGGIYPSDLVFSKAGYGKYWSLTQANQRYIGRDKRVGFENFLAHENATVYWDSHILTTGGNFTSQRMFILNWDFLHFNILEDGNFAVDDKSPVNADGYAVMLKLYCQMTCSARRFQGCLDNFTVA